VRDQAHSERIAAVAIAVFVVAVVALWQSWQVGVVVALAVGVAGTVVIGVGMQRQAAAVPHDGEIDFDAPLPSDLGRDVRRMRVRLGDDWVDFARAAAVVTASQWASTAGLQRDLGVPASRARHLLDLLEAEGFIGPARGTAPRAVLVPAESAGEVRRLLHVHPDTPQFLSTR
jgi:DNA segregation ATPase FtsK/SpoIIIE-like protein